MSKYRDRHGNRIAQGSIVAAAITINHATFRGFNFEVTVCKKHGRDLILDGVHGWSRLAERNARELCVLGPQTDLRRLYAEFGKEFPPR
jgi:hypothetical protein